MLHTHCLHLLSSSISYPAASDIQQQHLHACLHFRHYDLGAWLRADGQHTALWPLQEEFLLGGRVGMRTDLETVIYDFFVSHFGLRQSAEMHLTAFLSSVMKYK